MVQKPSLPKVIPVDPADVTTVRLPYVVLVDGDGNQLQPLPEGLEDGDLLRWNAGEQRFDRIAAPGAFVAAPSGGITSDGQARTAINNIRQLLIDLNLMEPQ